MCHPDAPEARTPAAERGEVTIDLDDGLAIDAFLAYPTSGTARASVLVIGDIWGARTPFYEHLAGLLAEQGFEAVVPEYFHRIGPLPDGPTYDDALGRKGRLDENRAVADLAQVLDWQRSRAPGARAGVLGFCLGGTFALDLAATRDDLATVCYYGFPAGSPGPPSELKAPSPLDQVDAISGPILGFWGSQDELVGIPNVESFQAKLRDRDVAIDANVLPDLGHGFLQAAWEPGADGHELASQSWARALAFLEEHTAG